jgi:hypothetical protein
MKPDKLFQILENIHILKTIELSDNQKILLAKAYAAGAIDGEHKHMPLFNEKLIAARDILFDLDIIDYDMVEETITVNQVGVDLMQRDGILDETGSQLTDIGKDYSAGNLPKSDSDTQPPMESITFKEFLKQSVIV